MQGLIMTLKLLFIFAILYTDSAISYEIKTVKYNISSSEDVICASSTIDDKYVGVKIHKNSSSCEGLDINWREGAEHQPGYKYVLKETMILKYNPPVLLNEESNYGNVIELWIPGLLTPGSAIKLFFTKQSPWERFRVRLRRNKEHPSDFLYQLFLLPTSLGFNHFNKSLSETKFVKRQFTEGVKRNLTIFVTLESFETFIDEELVYIFPHVFDPSAGRRIWIQSYGITKVTIHSLDINLNILN